VVTIAASAASTPRANRRAVVSRARVIEALGSVADPEIPNLSIVELGMVGDIAVGPGSIRVDILPTFVACPAIEMIRLAVADRLSSFADRIDVDITFSPPWTTERISPSGREKLRRSGFAPPPVIPVGRGLPLLDPQPRPAAAAAFDQPVDCPLCGSSATVLEGAFGPTPCRAIRHCTACRQPFEAFKAV
jgi:ring-1,2-phenylacetyl-CoA epoxidase subunit PaaD